MFNTPIPIPINDIDKLNLCFEFSYNLNTICDLMNFDIMKIHETPIKFIVLERITEGKIIGKEFLYSQFKLFIQNRIVDNEIFKSKTLISENMFIMNRKEII